MKQVLGALLAALVLSGCAARPPEPARQQAANALDGFFQEKLGDPGLCQAEIRAYQENYNAAWELVYLGLAGRMLSAAGDSPFGLEAAVAFYAETDLSWAGAAEAARASWWDFQEDAWGNGTQDALNLYHGRYLRDRCGLLSSWEDVTAYLPGPKALEACWTENGLDLDALEGLLAENGLPCRLTEEAAFALSCARALAGGQLSGEDGVSMFALCDLNGDGRRELLTGSPYGGFAVHVPDEAGFQRQIWSEGGAYTDLKVLDGGILWLHDGTHVTVRDSYYRMDGGGMTCLHDLALTPVSAGITDCRDGASAISEAAYADILAQYAALPQGGEADGLQWLSNDRETLSRAFSRFLLSESHK